MTREQCKMEERRPISQEIDCNSFYEETVSSQRTGGPADETSVIPTLSSEDNKDPNVGTAHERTKRLVVETQKMCQIVFKHVLFMKE